MRYIAMSVVLLLSVAVSWADDYIKDGRLTHTLKISQRQGGFAGFTGFDYTIEPDGTWEKTNAFNKKLTSAGKGKLSAKELEMVADILKKNDLEKLPEKSGKVPGANPHTITFEFGKAKATIVGQTPPKLDKDNPGAVESRFAAIYQGVTGMIKAADKKDGE
jgi:hypothetical protein